MQFCYMSARQSFPVQVGSFWPESAAVWTGYYGMLLVKTLGGPVLTQWNLTKLTSANDSELVQNIGF